MAAASRGIPSVLVVDDDAESLAALSEILTLEGYSVIPARNGAEALEHLRNSPHPRLMIVDLVMPAMDGRELLARKRRDPAIAAVPVIVMSGLDAKVEADASLTKPFQIEHLFRTMRMLMRQEPAVARV